MTECGTSPWLYYMLVFLLHHQVEKHPKFVHGVSNHVYAQLFFLFQSFQLHVCQQNCILDNANSDMAIRLISYFSATRKFFEKIFQIFEIIQSVCIDNYRQSEIKCNHIECKIITNSASINITHVNIFIPLNSI